MSALKLITPIVLAFACFSPASERSPAPPVPTETKLDVRKAVVETPTKKVVIPDGGKRVLESPLKKAITTTTAFTNPKTAPGLVRWHADLDAACAAAKKSHKPVFLFQMMGKLDDEFC